MSKIQVRQDSTYGHVLVKDNRDAFCPYQQAIPMQGQVGGLSLMRLPCSTLCAKANYTILDGNTSVYSVDCGSEPTKYEIESEKVDLIV